MPPVKQKTPPTEDNSNAKKPAVTSAMSTTETIDFGQGFPDLPSWTKAAASADATINLVSQKDSNKILAAYSVHRSALASQSPHFKRMFQRSSTIEYVLPSPLVTKDHFEAFLDSFYTGKFHFDPSDYICILPMVAINPSLKTRLVQAFQSPKYSIHYPKYIEDAFEMADDSSSYKITYNLAKSCVGFPNAVEVWRLIWKERMDCYETAKEHRKWSIALAEFLKLRAKDIDKETFAYFTSKDALPHVSKLACISIMELEQHYGLDEDELNDNDGMTCLQRRCATGLACCFQSSQQKGSVLKPLEGRLRKLRPAVFEHLLLDFLAHDVPVLPKIVDVMHEDGDGDDEDEYLQVYGTFELEDDAIPYYWRRRGKRHDETVDYCLYKYDTNCWMINAFDPGEGPGEDPLYEIYDNQGEQACGHLPPKRGWSEEEMSIHYDTLHNDPFY